jgi:hypothetical protein
VYAAIWWLFLVVFQISDYVNHQCVIRINLSLLLLYMGEPVQTATRRNEKAPNVGTFIGTTRGSGTRVTGRGS